MAVKIDGHVIDDLAKIDGKDIITLGDAVAGDVKSGKTFYAANSSLKTGAMPIKAIVAGSDLYEEGYHAGDGGGLDAIDTDLAVGNIKKDVVIFGKTGTYEATLVEDVIGTTPSGVTSDSNAGVSHKTATIPAGTDEDMASNTQSFAALSRAVAVGWMTFLNVYTSSIKVRLYMGGVQVAESAFATNFSMRIVIGTRALSGSTICKIAAHNYDGSSRRSGASGVGLSGTPLASGIGVGSIRT